MRRRIPIALPVATWLAATAMAQTPAQPNPAQPAAGAARLTVSLQDALERARANSPQFQSANISALLAREDRVQSKAGLLPTVNYFNQYIYTQGNGTPSGVFVANDGVHIYNSQAQVHGDLYAPGKLADYRRTIAAEAIARAKAEITARGLVVTVVQSYYGLVAAERKLQFAQQSLREAQQFFDITQKQEQGGESAHSDVVKAQIQLEQRQRDAQEAGLAVEKGRVGLAVLLFPDFQQDFDVMDDLQNPLNLPPFPEVQALAAKNNPDIRAAQAAVEQEKWGVSSARSGYLPSLSFDYFFGIDANQFAIDNRHDERNLGSVVQAQLTIPVWNWGATRSKLRQAQLHLQQAKLDLSATQRQLLANLNSFFQEAQTAGSQVSSLSHSADLATESLKLTLLRYTAGEVTVLEVVDAQTTLAQARNAYADGLLRYRVALSDLQTLTGSF
ncbi:MAG TPA: TolC family protein [Bryobacteraceae bacterium]|nr:TolC family protein [Bryobacteraceae bacterium]